MMRSLLLLCVIALSFPLHNCLAETEIGGGIFEPTTFFASESPYIVTEDLVAFPGADVYIEAGVEMQFAEGVKFEFREADLAIQGSEEAPVLLTSTYSSPIPSQRWAGIINEDVESGGVIFELSHLIIEHAETGLNYGGGYGQHSIDNVVFRDNGTGVYDGGLGYNWIEIFYGTFSNNEVGMRGRMSAYYCEFENNGVGFADPMTFGDYSDGARVQECSFTNNDVGIGIQATFAVNVAIVDNSTFVGNGKGIELYWADVDGCLFAQNEEFGVFSQKGYIRNSFFNDNGIGYKSSINPYTLSIYANEFDDNVVGIQMEGSGALVYDNLFCGSSDFDAVLNTNEAVDLSNNCWCSTDAEFIATRIYDAYDDVEQGICTYEPFEIECGATALYPGDFNNDGEADMLDLMFLGFRMGQTGPAREDASNMWTAQVAADWEDSFENGVNLKYADGDGDGIITTNDASLLAEYFGMSHYVASAMPHLTSEDAAVTIEMSPGFDSSTNSLWLDMAMDSELGDVEGLYGFTATLMLPMEWIDAEQISLSWADSWLLSSDLSPLTHTHYDPASGQLEIGISRTDWADVSGQGNIVRLHIGLNSEGMDMIESGSDQLYVTLEGGQALKSDTHFLSMNNSPTPIVFFGSILGLEETTATSADIKLYPNPTSQDLFLDFSSTTEIKSIQLYNTTGVLLANYAADSRRFSLSQFEQGAYFLLIETAQGPLIRPLQILR